MGRWEALDPTGFAHALDQGAHFRLFFFQPEAVNLFADDAFSPDIQALGAAGSAAAGWDQTRCLSRRAEPSDHSVNGRSTDTKLAAYRFDDLSRGGPVVRLQQAAQENVSAFGFKPPRVVWVVEETRHALIVRSIRRSINPN